MNIILLFILFPILLSWIIKIRKLRNTIIMQKRAINLSLGSSYVLLYWTVFDQLIANSSYIFPRGSKYNILIRIINRSEYSIIAQCVVFLLLLRFWIIYYEFNYAVSISNSKWENSYTTKYS